MPEMKAMKDYCSHRLLITGPPHELKQFERKADWRGKFSNARFERHCLAEYSQVFKTVSVDAAYYQFPIVRWLEAMVSQVPDDFQFTLKVTDEITLKRFPNLPRFGQRAGKPNEYFLNADLLASVFLRACVPFRANLGVLMFEFSQFHLREPSA